MDVSLDLKRTQAILQAQIDKLQLSFEYRNSRLITCVSRHVFERERQDQKATKTFCDVLAAQVAVAYLKSRENNSYRWTKLPGKDCSGQVQPWSVSETQPGRSPLTLSQKRFEFHQQNCAPYLGLVRV